MERLRNPPWRARSARPIPATIDPIRKMFLLRAVRAAKKLEGDSSRTRPETWDRRISTNGWALVAYDTRVHYFGREWGPETACGRWRLDTPSFKTYAEGLARLTCADCKANLEYRREVADQREWEKAREWRLRRIGRPPQQTPWRVD